MTRLQVITKAIIEAGDYLKNNFHKRHQVSWKKDETVLLGEDMKAEEILMKGIRNFFPSDSFLTEEQDTTITSDDIWVFDPLCGSYSYLRGVETWSLSAALIHDDQYKIGVVYQPLLNNLFTSEQEQGAYLNNSKIESSFTKEIKDAFISLEHGVFASGKIDCNELINQVKRIRVAHGSGGELAYVASGYLDGLIKTDQALMHFAGGRAILEEIGGLFIDFAGKRAPTYLDKNKTTDYIACNKYLAKEILKFVNVKGGKYD